MISEGSRVSTPDGAGSVIYIDKPSMLVDHFFPVEVELDKPYDHSHTIKRYSLKEVEEIENNSQEKL